ncbi:hypothetical protein [Pontibacter sp. H249]|uniref:hypothetical protein n=1 Tax=Pontibacter sp. H249 TaxID=3133420 RepID=UPI0030C01E34
MKQILLLMCVLISWAAHAQTTTWGLTTRAGGFTTVKTSGNGVESYDRGIGGRVELGAWLQQPVSERGRLQVSVLQSAERQAAGTIMFISENRNSISDLDVVDRNLAVNTTLLYLYKLNDAWSIGAGAGGVYEYLSNAKVSGDIMWGQPNIAQKYKESFENHYRRDLRFYLPLELQRQLTERITLAGQVQAQLSNLQAASETKQKEKNIGLMVGVNYTL